MKAGLVFTCFMYALFMNSVFADNNRLYLTKESRIESVSDIQHWCKEESSRYFKRKKMKTYNWTVRTIRTLNEYHSLGNWLLKNRQIKVSCSIRIGRKAKYTKIEIPAKP